MTHRSPTGPAYPVNGRARKLEKPSSFSHCAIREAPRADWTIRCSASDPSVSWDWNSRSCWNGGQLVINSLENLELFFENRDVDSFSDLVIKLGQKLSA